MDLSIIVPMYNESKFIATTLDRLLCTNVPSFVGKKEIIVVDDCSDDVSYEVVDDYASSHEGIRVLRHEMNMGKGAAVKTGAMAASGDILLFQDADMELDPSDIPAILTLMHDENLKIAGGSRFITKSRHSSNKWLSDYANKIFSGMASLISGKKITDLTCGYKAVKKDLFMELVLRENRFGFETEMMMKLLSGTATTFSETPVKYYPRKRSEGKKIRMHDGPLIITKILRYGFSGRRWISALTAIMAVLIVFTTIIVDKRWKKENRVIEWDVISYYAYLPATFIYHDPGLSFIDGYKGPHKFIFWPEKGPTGKYVIKTTMGLSFLYLPFFLVGHAAALMTGYDAGGFSEPYKIALLMSAVFFLALGLFYLRKLLLEYFNDVVTAMVISGFVFGTNLFFYSTYQAAMSHVYSFALIACFLWYTIRWHRDPSIKKTVISGLLIGLISLIRPANVIILLVFIFYDVYNGRSIKEKAGFFLKQYRMLLLMAGFALLVWIPQFIYWKAMTGHLLYYSYTNNERFFFNHPQIINGLFSYRKGLLIYTPLAFFSFVGIYSLWRNKSPFALAFSFFLPVNIYIIFSWWCWWYGGSFGQRPFIDTYALMALPVASLLQASSTNKRILIRAPVMFFFIIAVSLGLYFHKQYYYGAIHWDSMTKEAFIDSFGRLHPSPEFNSLLAEPDYEKAKEGIQATVPKGNP
jgi:glycosyltransferase involved in cell wall biosynthesis